MVIWRWKKVEGVVDMKNPLEVVGEDRDTVVVAAVDDGVGQEVDEEFDF